jgi:exonuclease SbcD
VKFLHTSDWHAGRAISMRSRDSELEAALQQILDYARQYEVDCLLIAGDVFDSSAPPPEAERLVYDFLRELRGARIPAVLIAGNHDHPRRIEAIAPLLRTLDIHALGEPRRAEDGGAITIKSRDGSETAVVAALPWVTERRAVDFSALLQGPEKAILGYAESVAQAMANLATAFRPDTVNVLMSHALVNDALVGAGGGERALSLTMGIYGIQRQRFPAQAQYVALGHVHKPQQVVASPAAWYSGSLLQLDFGEAEQAKSVNLVELRPRLPASVTPLAIDRGVRQLIDIGSPLHGIALNDLAAHAARVGEAWLRVFVDLDLPVANLPLLVREVLPNAVQVIRSQTVIEAETIETQEPVLSQEELFSTFYRSALGRGTEPSASTMTLFRRLLHEEAEAASDV